MDMSLKEQIAEELEIDVNALTPDTVLKDLEYWDSVTALTIMAMIDTHIGKPVSPDEFTEIRTFGDMEALVDKSAGQMDES